MYPYNRRPYITKVPERSSTQTTENTEIDKSNSVNSENIKLLFENVNEIKNTLKKFEENMAEIALKLINLESRLSIYDKYRNVQTQYNSQSVSSQINSQEDTDYETDYYQQPEKNTERPIMPGTGFSHITKDYLRNLSKTDKKKSE